MGNKNETLIQVPADVTDQLQLRKFLLSLIEKLDIILGYRGQDPYLTRTDLVSTADALSSLPETLSSIESDLESNRKRIVNLESDTQDLDSRIDSITVGLNTTQSLSSSYNDFNFSGYFTLKGTYQFTALGSAITNPPAGAGLVGGTIYTVFISSYTTINGGVVQEVYITSATTKTFHKRAGDTSALVLSLGWF